MARLEVVAPAAEIDQIIHNLGKLEIVQFININALKEEKYKAVAEEVKRSPREDQLQQLTNRIGSTMKKLGEIPVPDPITVKENATELLKEIDVETQTLEVEVARIENEMKNLLEERASAERETLRFQEELESSRRFQDLELYQSSLDDIAPQMFHHKEEIRKVYARLLDVQKTLSIIDAASKLQPNQGNLSNDEGHVKNLSETLQKTRVLHEKLRGSGSVTKENLGYLDSFIREVGEAIDRKSESISKLQALRVEASALVNDINNLKQTLPQFAERFLGEAFQSKLLQTLDSITKLSFDSKEIEELTHRVGQHTYDVLRIAESLENVERFIGLRRVKKLLDEVRRQNATGIDGLLHGYEDLVRKVPSDHLKIVERALRTFYMEKRVEELADLPNQLSSRLEAVGTSSTKIHAYREIVEIELRIEDMKKFFRQTSKTNVFEVWVKKSDADRVMAEVKSSSPGSMVVATGEEKGDRPPTAMRFPKLMTAYAKLTAGYGVPNYRELDPTMIMIFTFPVLFGLMFGDMGQGAIVVIGGFLIPPIFKRLKISGPLWDPLVQGRNIIITCGIMAIFFGFMFGSFFGETTLRNFEEGRVPFALYSWVTGLPDAFWFAPLAPPFGPIKLLKVAVIIAISQLLLGMAMDLYNRLSQKQYRQSIASFSRLWFQASLGYLLLTYKFEIATVLMMPSKDPIPLTLFFLAPLIGVIVLHWVSLGNLFEGVTEGLGRLIEAISNTASYARILAIGMVHAVFNLMALLINDLSSPLFWVIFIVTNLMLLLALNGILAFAHSLRLHWVEWFSKFYSGDGTRFERFSIRRRFTLAV